MAGDYEDMNDIEALTDDELLALLKQQLAGHPDVDIDRIDVTVSEGRVILAGRVGTESEFQIIEHLLTDVIGVGTVENGLVVDELVRAEQPEAADEANELVYGGGGSAHGGADRTEDSAEHLLNDTAAEQRGTDDVGEAVERGHSYNPPDSPVQEGTWSKEDH
ncbi:hypothetical protein BH23GEM10_BH23GEM10_07770 [soil metagenome]